VRVADAVATLDLAGPAWLARSSSGHERSVSILKILGVGQRLLESGQARLGIGTDVPRIAARATGNVVTIDFSSKIFERTNRVVVWIETDEQEAAGELLLLRRGGRFAAMVNRCPHLGRTLEDAIVRGNVLVCPGHGKHYNLNPGQRRCAASALCLLPVRDDGDALTIDIEGIAL